MNARTLLLLSATLLLAAPGAAATDLDEPVSPEIRCMDDPAGWTVCFVYNGLTVACPFLTVVDAAQCLLNHEVDNAQAYTDRMCTHVFQPWVCEQPPVYSPGEDNPVDCVDHPVGWTACFVVGVGLIVAYGCPDMRMDSEWAQCVTNKEIDSTQWYANRMCAYVFQPWVCDNGIA